MPVEGRVKKLWEIWRKCKLCPRGCLVNREVRAGVCGIGKELLIGSWGPHPGEEGPLVGWRGSGTIFFAGCNLKCVFCQNYDLSHQVRGTRAGVDELVTIMFSLEKYGCHNINFVTPTHLVPWIAEALIIAREKGLTIPAVYNCGGYESVEVLKLLDGLIEIYMPDIKYGSDPVGEKYSGVPDYWEVARKALKEMHEQVGDLEINGQGLAQKGLLVRHLLLPGQSEGARTVMDFLQKEISPNTYFNLMAQYYPAYRSRDFPELMSRISLSEYRLLQKEAKEKGFRLDK